MESSYKTEIARYIERLKEDNERAENSKILRVSTIFFGGGTPSTAPPSFLSSLISYSLSLLTPSPNLEITIEANPTVLFGSLISVNL